MDLKNGSGQEQHKWDLVSNFQVCQNPPKLRKLACVMWKDAPVLVFSLQAGRKDLTHRPKVLPHARLWWNFPASLYLDSETDPVSKQWLDLGRSTKLVLASVVENVQGLFDLSALCASSIRFRQVELKCWLPLIFIEPWTCPGAWQSIDQTTWLHSGTAFHLATRPDLTIVKFCCGLLEILYFMVLAGPYALYLMSIYVATCIKINRDLFTISVDQRLANFINTRWRHDSRRWRTRRKQLVGETTINQILHGL